MQAVALLLALCVSSVDGASLRRASEDPAKPKDIKAKWDKMDDFLEVMFTMACKWKQGKDVNGAAAEQLKEGKVKGADGYAAAVKDIQTGNVKGLQKTCGFIIAENKKSCRDGCASGWNALAQKRNDCDEKCESVYGNFERSCYAKVQMLEKVNDQKSAMAAAQKQCYEGHCKEFPMVWMKEKAKDQTKEVKDQCDARCTKKNVKIGCQEKWAAEIDYVVAEVNSKCAAASGISDCLDKKKADVTKTHDSCMTDSKKDCDTAYDTCTKKSNADKNFKDAKAFCDDRKTMCVKQTDKKCLDGNKAGLAEAEAECKAENSGDVTKCQDEKLTAMEKTAEDKCIGKRTPTCKGNCQKSCEVTKMNDCLTKLKSQTKDDPGQMFCKDFWRLLHTSAEVDAVTGNPVDGNEGGRLSDKRLA